MRINKAAITTAGIATAFAMKDSIIGDIGVRIGDKTGISDKVAGAITYPFKKMGGLFKSKPTLMDKAISHIQNPQILGSIALGAIGLGLTGLFMNNKSKTDNDDIEMQSLPK